MFLLLLIDVRLIRDTHHIVGALTGSLPRAPRQNNQLGLPLKLMPEEAFALITYGKMMNPRPVLASPYPSLHFQGMIFPVSHRKMLYKCIDSSFLLRNYRLVDERENPEPLEMLHKT